jgi:hypothetical protein
MNKKELRLKLADLNSEKLPNPPILVFCGGKIENGELTIVFYA